MRKARRAMDQQVPDSSVPYPQYGYPSVGMVNQPGPPLYAPTAGMYAPGPSNIGFPNQQPLSNEQLNFNIPTQLFQNPAVANMALQYGQTLMGQGKEVIDRELNKYVSTSRVKYYFSVDTSYVAKKLSLVLFPFTHRDWTIKYNPEEPVQPRFELNAPDLYIPTMAFVTYLLVGGIALGMQNKFTPEVLGMQASTALVWAVIEVLSIWLTLYIMNIQTNLTTFDIMAFTSYKYVGMIVTILVSFAIPSGYHLALAYVSAAVMYFLVRSLKVQVLPESSRDPYVSGGGAAGSKRRSYLLVFITLLQPLLMWWLTRHLVLSST